MDVIDKNYEFDTKCKRCGSIIKNLFGIATGYIEDEEFFDSEMRSMTVDPYILFCPTCNKKTVQDLVSFTDTD